MSLNKKVSRRFLANVAFMATLLCFAILSAIAWLLDLVERLDQLASEEKKMKDPPKVSITLTQLAIGWLTALPFLIIIYVWVSQGPAAAWIVAKAIVYLAVGILTALSLVYLAIKKL